METTQTAHESLPKATEGTTVVLLRAAAGLGLGLAATVLPHKPEASFQTVKGGRGHDRRCVIDGSKLRHELCWRPSVPCERGLAETVRWYCEAGK